MALWDFICGGCCVVMLLLQCFSGLQRCNSTIHGVSSSSSSSIMIASKALLDFKAGLTSASSEGGSVLPSWINGSNPCNEGSQPWEGVTCSSDDAAGQNVIVAALRLKDRGLWGVISPTALAMLCEAGLTVLDLSNNSLSASVPAEALGACRSLRHLDLSRNSFSGSLAPSAFSDLSALRHLDLSWSGFNGSLAPSAFSDLSALRHLDLSCNGFSGSLAPSAFSDLSALRHLDLSWNGFSGSLAPSAFSNLSAGLRHLDLSYNSFSGSLPPSIWHLPALRTLNLELPGSDHYIVQAPDIPEDLPFCANITQLLVSGVSLMPTNGRNLMTSLSKCAKKLQSVNLRETNLTGSIPEDFWHLPSLMDLVLESAGTLMSTSSLPASTTSCSKNLQTLVLYNVPLGGATLPPFLGNCKNLGVLAFAQTGVQGVIPQAIWELPALTDIVLDEPHLTSEASLPPQLPSCATIRTIIIRGVNIGGQIPPSLGGCSGLSFLTLSGVGMRGPIPETLGNLNLTLVFLDLSNNSLDGEVPTSALISCTSLQILYLHQNSLTGALDQLELWKMMDLAIFKAHHNRLHGRVTANLTSSSSLLLVDLSNNNLSGELPSEKESQGLRGLRVLILSNNRLSGRIPTWVWELPNLQILELSNCRLTGVIPASVAQLPYFKRNDPTSYTITLDSSTFTSDIYVPGEYHFDIPIKKGEHQLLLTYLSSNRISLDLSHNSFRGPIPDGLGELVGLTSLDLSHNSLSGPIPPSLGNLAHLEFLDLSSNSLRGPIPSRLGLLSSLGTLNLSNNHLVGPIPTTHNFNTRFDASCFQGNTGLCGFPLTNPCTKNTTTNTTKNTTNSDDTTLSSWFDANISLGGLVLGYILGLLGTFCLLWWRNMKDGWLIPVLRALVNLY